MRAQKEPAQSFGFKGIQTQHLSHAKQAPYHYTTAPSLANILFSKTLIKISATVLLEFVHTHTHTERESERKREKRKRERETDRQSDRQTN